MFLLRLYQFAFRLHQTLVILPPRPTLGTGPRFLLVGQTASVLSSHIASLELLVNTSSQFSLPYATSNLIHFPFLPVQTRLGGNRCTRHQSHHSFFELIRLFMNDLHALKLNRALVMNPNSRLSVPMKMQYFGKPTLVALLVALSELNGLLIRLRHRRRWTGSI